MHIPIKGAIRIDAPTHAEQYISDVIDGFWWAFSQSNAGTTERLGERAIRYERPYDFLPANLSPLRFFRMVNVQIEPVEKELVVRYALGLSLENIILAALIGAASVIVLSWQKALGLTLLFPSILLIQGIVGVQAAKRWLRDVVVRATRETTGS